MKLVIQQVVKDNSALVLFKVRLKTLARKLGFDSVRMENMQIVASEMLSNQIKYSGKTGMVQLWCNALAENTRNKNAPPVTLDIFAMDYGPGIADIDQAFEDGYTTSRTMGKGLGSVKRLADEYDVYSLTEDKEKKLNPGMEWLSGHVFIYMLKNVQRTISWVFLNGPGTTVRLTVIIFIYC